MKIVKSKALNKKSIKTAPNYSSWDALTQAKYLYDLNQQLGNSARLVDCYQLAQKAISSAD